METVVLTKEEFDQLLEYSSSIPSGTVLGKVWKRNQNFHSGKKPGDWYMGEYVPDVKAKMDRDGKPETIGIIWRKIEIK